MQNEAVKKTEDWHRENINEYYDWMKKDGVTFRFRRTHNKYGLDKIDEQDIRIYCSFYSPFTYTDVCGNIAALPNRVGSSSDILYLDNIKFGFEGESAEDNSTKVEIIEMSTYLFVNKIGYTYAAQEEPEYTFSLTLVVKTDIGKPHSSFKYAFMPIDVIRDGNKFDLALNPTQYYGSGCGTNQTRMNKYMFETLIRFVNNNAYRITNIRFQQTDLQTLVTGPQAATLQNRMRFNHSQHADRYIEEDKKSFAISTDLLVAKYGFLEDALSLVRENTFTGHYLLLPLQSEQFRRVFFSLQYQCLRVIQQQLANTPFSDESVFKQTFKEHAERVQSALENLDTLFEPDKQTIVAMGRR